MDKFPFKRHCPKCNREIFYSRKDSLKRAETQNRLCSSCTISGENNPFYGKHHTDISNKKNAEWHKGRKTSDIHKLNTSRNHSKYWLGKKRSEQDREKMRKAKLGKPSNRKGKPCSLEHKIKLKEVHKKNWESGKEKINSGNFKKGSKPWNKDKSHKEDRRILSSNYSIKK